MTSDQVQQSIALPANFTMRPAQPEDAEGVAALFDARAKEVGLTRIHDADTFREDWDSVWMRGREASTRVVVDETSGDIVGYSAVWDADQPPVKVRISWVVRRGLLTSTIPQCLINWAEATGRRVIEECPPQARITYRCGAQADNNAVRRILEAAGYRRIREFWRMVIHMEDAPSAPQLPDGFSFRAYRHPQDLDDLIKVDTDAFRDHWGFVENEDHDAEREKWRYWLDSSKTFDPSLSFFVVEEATDQIAGFILTFSEQEDDPTVAYVDALGIRPQYRRRGLATALLRHGFAQYWQRGRKSVALHVDATSLTGATRVYERAGMHVDDKGIAYEKVLRDGEEISTTDLDS